jgi:hypothetical protein
MLLRNKVGTKFLLYYHLPVKVFLSIIMSQKRRYGKFNLSIRIIGNTIMITSTAQTYGVIVKMTS